MPTRVYLICLICPLVLSLLTLAARINAADSVYIEDPNDFASEVVSYYQGTAGIEVDYVYQPFGMLFNNPQTALGRPTIDTTGDNWYIPESTPCPVNPVNPPFRYFEIVGIGFGGQLTVKFDHPVRDDVNNPYGIDFIVFGNTPQTIGQGDGWLNDDPAGTSVTGGGYPEPGIVSVSQDGTTWYTYSSGPFADDFAPTMGRHYDPCEPNEALGAWNLWWGQAKNPTVPLNPSLDFADFGGMTVAQIAQAYGDSAGGTGFNLSALPLPVDPATGLKWIQYVRISNPNAAGVTPEIDAVSDVRSCGDWRSPIPTGDINADCRVDLTDLMLLADAWLTTDSAADLDTSGRVDLGDLNTLNDHWGQCTWNCQD